MPPRVARSSIQSSGSSSKSKGRSNARNPKKAQKRALNAYAIAEHDNLDSPKIRKNRLGEFDPAFNRKRARDEDDEDEDDEEDDDEEGGPKRRKRRTGDESYDEGSDSEGNTWQMGHVDNNDSDDSIDSDEAFGDSDEERFEGFTFRGSSKSQKSKPKKSKRRQDLQDEDGDIDLDEGDSADGEEEYDEDDLGEDAIDLATALDQYEEDEEEERREKKKQKKRASGFVDSDDEPSDEYGSDSDEPSDKESDEDDEDDENGYRQAQLQDLISSLASKEDDKPKGKRVEVHESAAPDEFGVSRKVDLLSLKPKVADAEKKKALKLLEDDNNSKRKDIGRKLDAPLPKRAQDKLDRAAANAKANETLDRWTDTIKRNRRAEHLIFPLQNPEGIRTGEKTLQPTTTAAPTNDLESTIQSILQQSGLSNGKEDEEKIQKWEELQTNKLPMEEVLKRRAELRMQRELLFREEVRAKRIKKIKSKAYRRVHRKEREKMLQKEREQLKADGVDLSEEEREYNDRRRAEERMGAKHRESKWAKGIKATGRAAWDQDALDGVTEMARRNEELRRRVEGKTVRDDDDEGSDLPSDEESESEGESDDDALQKSLGKLKENPFSTGKSKLGEMAFMQRSEAARRAQNDEAVESLRRELAGEDSAEEEIDENATKAGRRKYGPSANVAAPAIQIGRSEFEEHPGSDEEQLVTQNEESAPEPTSKAPAPKKNVISGLSNGARKDRNGTAAAAETESGSSNPFLVKAKKDKKASKESELLAVTEVSNSSVPEKAVAASKPVTKPKSQAKPKQVEKPQETKVDDFLKQRVTAADDDGWATVLGGQDDDDDQDEQDIEDEGIDLDIVMRNQALTAKGFAGDDVVAEFDAEKKATVAEEETTETTSYLPGWGAWTGDGMSKAEKKRNLGAKTVIHKPGIDADKRKDKRLDKVIINERKIKPNVKYMASQLPFPFETREQYERSLRVPKGKEWVTKKTHQDVTKPRVIVKQGVIKPLRKPLV